MDKKNLGSHILPERMGRFTWNEGDLKFFKTEEDFMKYAEENSMTVTKYENFKGDEQPKMNRTALQGAILGDIIGMPYEFDCDVDSISKMKNFYFFQGECFFTDDSVMAVAFADALISVDKDTDED